MTHIIPSDPRTSAFCRLLVGLSKSFGLRNPARRIDTTKGDDNNGLGKIINGKIQQPPLPNFKRLHVLYVLHDVLLTMQLHGIPFSNTDGNTQRALSPLSDIVITTLKRHTQVLVTLAAYSSQANPFKACLKVRAILHIWRDYGIFNTAELNDLEYRTVTAEQSLTDWETFVKLVASDHASIEAELKRQAQDAKLVLPIRHGLPGDPSAPWHELPAANGLYMKRTRGYPLRSYAMPAGGYEVPGGGEYDHFARPKLILTRDTGQMPDVDLKAEIQQLHSEMKHQFEKYTNADDVQDVDALGNIIYKDPDRPTRNYWGFSYDGITKMKETAIYFKDKGIGYADVPIPRSMQSVDSAVERARNLAAERAAGMGRGGGYGGGRGGGRGAPGGWRASARGYGHRGDRVY